MKQLMLILSMLLFSLINGIEPQIKVGEMIIHILIKVGSIKTQGALLSMAPSHSGSIYLRLKQYSSRITENT